MKIDKFILYDNVSDENTLDYADLILFGKEYEEEEVRKVINNVKDSLPGEYTNEDIYSALYENFYINVVIELDDIITIGY